MGGGGSTTSKSIIDPYTLNQNITNILNRNTSNISTSNVLLNSIRVDNQGKFNCPNGLNTSQVIGANLRNITNVDNTVVNDIKNSIQNDITSAIDQNTKKVQDTISSIFGSGSTVTVAEIKNRIDNIIEKTITTENVNNIVHSNQLENNFVWVNRPGGEVSGASCNITQDIQAKIISQSMVQNTINALLADDTLNKLNNGIQQATSEETNLKGKGKGNKGSIWRIILIILAILIVVGLIIGLIMFLTKKPSSSSASASSGGKGGSSDLASVATRAALAYETGGASQILGH